MITQHKTNQTNNDPTKNKKNKPLKYATNIWWNEECEKARIDRIQAEANFINSPNESTRTNKNKFTAIAKKIYKKTKKKAWKTFCNSLNNLTPSKVIWDKLKKFYSKNNNCQSTFNSTMNLAVRPEIDALKESLSLPPNTIHPYPSNNTFNQNQKMDKEITLD